ncbi:hypothetical protein M011DRAFT_289980 [Sporormia fimetaria CBS 119925]|uniref:Uncharacterized protein n=1 Tax=Sporormia fimetaria CBS 119925 TaxID=1340428 RepID=A0A6A6UYY2_9PLEO|nr:hypothetical protein M011DRAFT_289980 [Sporormia fimetaria CBS 119925]
MSSIVSSAQEQAPEGTPLPPAWISTPTGIAMIVLISFTLATSIVLIIKFVFLPWRRRFIERKEAEWQRQRLRVRARSHMRHTRNPDLELGRIAARRYYDRQLGVTRDNGSNITLPSYHSQDPNPTWEVLPQIPVLETETTAAPVVPQPPAPVVLIRNGAPLQRFNAQGTRRTSDPDNTQAGATIETATVARRAPNMSLRDFIRLRDIQAARPSAPVANGEAQTSDNGSVSGVDNEQNATAATGEPETQETTAEVFPNATDEAFGVDSLYIDDSQPAQVAAVDVAQGEETFGIDSLYVDDSQQAPIEAAKDHEAVTPEAVVTESSNGEMYDEVSLSPVSTVNDADVPEPNSISLDVTDKPLDGDVALQPKNGEVDDFVLRLRSMAPGMR